MQNFKPSSSPLKDISNCNNYPCPENPAKVFNHEKMKPYSPLKMGSNKKNPKKMWEYDWTLLIPETHKESGSLF